MKKIITVLLFIFLFQNVFGEDSITGWNLGDFGLSYNTRNGADMQIRLLEFNQLWSPFAFSDKYHIINFENRFVFNVSLYKLIINKIFYTSFLPVEIGYSPFNFNDDFYFILYAVAELQFLKYDNNRYFFQVEIDFFLHLV
ncbi:MAG: hypothetical protein LBE13_13925 [Bacteroidales bacterium]|nr:hypothetical protein [Bacteroidales bacterium]